MKPFKIFFIWIVIVSSLALGGVAYAQDDFDILDFLPAILAKPSYSKVIGPEGGVIDITDPQSPLYGVRVEIFEAALNEDKLITISKQYGSLQLPDGIIPIGPTINFGPDDIEFEIPIEITIPYNSSSVTAEDLVIPFASDHICSLYAPPVVTIDEVSGRITIQTIHFSDHQAAKQLKGQILSAYLTNFDPSKNGFPTKSEELCIGMAGFAKWFYDRYGWCKDLASLDAEIAQQIASKAHDKARWGIGGWIKYWNRFLVQREYQLLRLKSEMLRTRSPQIVIQWQGGLTKFHAVLAYGYDGDKIYCYDPWFGGGIELRWSDNMAFFSIEELFDLYSLGDLFEEYKDYLACGQQWLIETSGDMNAHQVDTFIDPDGNTHVYVTDYVVPLWGPWFMNITQSETIITGEDEYGNTLSGTIEGSSVAFTISQVPIEVGSCEYYGFTYTFTGTINEDTITGSVNGEVHAYCEWSGDHYSHYSQVDYVGSGNFAITIFMDTLEMAASLASGLGGKLGTGSYFAANLNAIPSWGLGIE